MSQRKTCLVQPHACVATTNAHTVHESAPARTCIIGLFMMLAIISGFDSSCCCMRLTSAPPGPPAPAPIMPCIMLIMSAPPLPAPAPNMPPSPPNGCAAGDAAAADAAVLLAAALLLAAAAGAGFAPRTRWIVESASTPTERPNFAELELVAASTNATSAMK
jgi:hypothetical protein